MLAFLHGQGSDWLFGLAVAHEPVGFTKDLGCRAGRIRACGHLSARTADLLCGAVLDLHDRGQTRIVPDVEAVQRADDSSFLMLQNLQTIVTAEGGTLIVLHPTVRGW